MPLPSTWGSAFNQDHKNLLSGEDEMCVGGLFGEVCVLGYGGEAWRGRKHRCVNVWL